jgi:autotransporter-associated beta strand protein
VISGTGTVTKSGAGTLTLTGTNTYQGGTTISGGTLAVSRDANLGAATGILSVRQGGTLQFIADNFTSNRNVTIGPGNAIFDTNGYNATLGGAITGGSGSTEFHKIGTGTLTLGGEQHLYRATPDPRRDADPHRRQPAKLVHVNHKQRRDAADRQWRRDRVACGQCQ